MFIVMITFHFHVRGSFKILCRFPKLERENVTNRTRSRFREKLIDNKSSGFGVIYGTWWSSVRTNATFWKCSDSVSMQPKENTTFSKMLQFDLREMQLFESVPTLFPYKWENSTFWKCFWSMFMEMDENAFLKKKMLWEFLSWSCPAVMPEAPI